jgi:hypothetical protein
MKLIITIKVINRKKRVAFEEWTIDVEKLKATPNPRQAVTSIFMESIRRVLPSINF